MSAVVEDFISSPSEALLDLCAKDQLFKIADHYGIEIGDKRVKDSTIRETLKTKLMEQSILFEIPATGQVKSHVGSLTFEQQERLLLLQLEQERLKLEVEREKTRNEQTNIELQKYRLDIIREGGLSGGSVDACQGASQMFDTAGNLRLVPKFNEQFLNTFLYCLSG